MITGYVYSGDVKVGTIGQETQLIDKTDQKLFVGDIVNIGYFDKLGSYSNKGLSVVVSNEWNRLVFESDVHNESSDIVHYVMGIRSVNFQTSSDWVVSKVKSYENIIDGEQLPQFDFRFEIREIDEKYTDDFLLLKFGGLKDYCINRNSHLQNLVDQYDYMEEKSSPIEDMKSVLCEIIEAFNGNIISWFSGDVFKTKTDAIQYINGYGK